MSRAAVFNKDASDEPLSGLRRLAISQANAAATTIVETNTLLDPEARVCLDCKPTQDALARQEKALLPVGARAKLARIRLWVASKAIDALARSDAAAQQGKLARFGELVWAGIRAAGAAYAALVAALCVVALLSPSLTTALPRRVDPLHVVRVPLLLLEFELSWG